MDYFKKIHILFIIFIGLLVSVVVGAQPKHLQLKQLSTNDGLSSSTIISILQDHKGFMWIGTIEGLNRYDGAEFKVYKHDRLNPLSIADNFIISMLLDGEKMYVGTNAGISIYNPSTDGFINFNKDSTSCLFNQTFQVREIIKGKNEGMYLGTRSGLTFFDPERNICENYLNAPQKDQNQTSTRTNSICLYDEENILIGTTSGLFLFNTNTKKFIPVNKGLNGEDYSKISVNNIIEDNNGEVWMTTYYNGLFRINKSKDGKLYLENYLNNSDGPNALSKNRLLSLTVDAQNNLWVGAENDGVFLIERGTNKISHFLSSEFDPLHTTTYSVECLQFDNSQNLWIGTFANGVNVAPKNGDAIISYSKFKGGDLGITNNMVNGFVEDKNGNIWVGTDGGGIHVLNKNTGLFRSITTKNSKLPSDYILSMAEDNDKIWMSTWGAGLLCYDLNKQVFQSFNTANSTIPDNNIFCIEKGDNNDLWLGSYSYGLVHYSPDENKFSIYNTDNSEISDNYVNVVRTGTDGNLFIGTQSGLVSFDKATEQFKEFSLLDLDSKTLSHLHVYDVLCENDTSVWAATLSGLNRVNPKTGKNLKITTQNGLPSNNVRGVLKDEMGNFWIATTGGICKFDKDLQQCSLFTKEDGLQSDEIRPRSMLKSSEGDLYFGGVNGFNIIYPDRIKENSKIPTVLITGLDIFNETVVPNAKDSPLKRTISEMQELRIPYNQSVLTFYFAVLDFTRPFKNQHAYMLENFDKDWIYCGHKREATYTNLDPGDYVLRVKGANNDGFWNEEGVALKITIIPPWWATWWFKGICWIALVALIVSIYYFRVSALKKQRAKLERTVKERTKELAEINATKDKLFSIIAHDLRNPFNTILGFTNLLIENFDNFEKHDMKDVLKNLKTSGETAFSLLENLLNWSLTQQDKIEFNPDVIYVDIYNEKILSEFQVLSDKKDIKLINNQKDKGLSVYADFNMLSLVFRNLITNAVKFSNQGTEIWLEANETENGWVTFCVTDHGIGIKKEKASLLFQLGEHDSTTGTKGEKGTGLGLILSKEFVERHKGRIWVESDLGKGSTFCFSLPSSEEVYNKA